MPLALDVHYLMQNAVDAASLGSLYALFALGIALIFGVMRLINFAHGEVLMVGALTSWSIIGWMQAAMPGTPGWIILVIALIIACIVAGTLNFIIEKLGPLRASGATYIAPVVAVLIGVAAGEQVTALEWGALGLILGGVVLIQTRRR